jgi:hypothetical protein
MEWFVHALALANLGLATMVAGFDLQPHLGARAIPILVTGGSLGALGAYLFILNAWRTINEPASHRTPRPVVAR